jgi:protein-disulfide isomerase
LCASARAQRLAGRCAAPPAVKLSLRRWRLPFWHPADTVIEVNANAPRPSDPVPSERPSSPAKSWIGIVAVAAGLVTMVAGVTSVYVYARHRLPPPGAAVASVAPPPAPPVLAAPVAPAQPAAPDEPAAPPLPLPEPLGTEPSEPFAEDARSPLPIDARAPVLGPRDAPATIVMFGDLTCPHTLAQLPLLLAEKARRGRDLRLAFRYLPLSQNAGSVAAARALAGLYADRGGEMLFRVLDAVGKQRAPLDRGDLAPILAMLGITDVDLENLGRAPASSDAVERDVELASALFVRATPTMFVNGVRLDGFHPAQALSAAIDRELRAAHLTLAGGVSPAQLYTTRTRKNLMNLGDDPEDRLCVRPAASPARGGEAAIVTVVGFSEFQCAACREGEAGLAAALRQNPSELRVVWKDFPLSQHPRARAAANFAHAARAIGGDKAFFAVHDRMLKLDSPLEDADLAAFASSAGLPADKLLEAARSERHAATIESDLRLAAELGVTGAPTYFVNGRKVPGAPVPSEFVALLREELSLARRVMQNGSGLISELACGARGVTPAMLAKASP